MMNDSSEYQHSFNMQIEPFSFLCACVITFAAFSRSLKALCTDFFIESRRRKTLSYTGFSAKQLTLILTPEVRPDHISNYIPLFRQSVKDPALVF